MNSHLPPDDFYLNVTQVAQRYGVSTDTIWRWARTGELPKGVKIGPSATRWRMADLTRHEESFRTGLIFAPMNDCSSFFGMVA